MTENEVFAVPINYVGKGAWTMPLKGTGFGVVFEDSGETGYFYATTENFQNVYDTLHLYDTKEGDVLTSADEIFIVWSPTLLKAAMYYHEKFQAVIDFKNQKACCRTGFPTPKEDWCKSSHEWDDSLVKGLER